MKAKRGKTSRSPKFYENDSLQNFLLPFMFLLTAKFARDTHIWIRIFFFVVKNLLKQSLNSFNIKFQSQWKSRKNGYQVRQPLALF